MLCFTSILTNSNHQHNGMEGTKKKLILQLLYYVLWTKLVKLFTFTTSIYRVIQLLYLRLQITSSVKI